MIKTVLIVDDDQEMLLSLKEGLERFSDSFSIILAGDGLIAVEKLQEHTISLVVTDLKMPRLDGFGLLAHIMENYPHIPVVMITGYSTPKMEELAREGGAVGYIEKPFMIDDLARTIITALRRESDGGTLHGISSGIFLQLIEMEQKTCTIRVFENLTGKQGVLFFKEGQLIDARSDGLQGEPAAQEIFMWDEVTLSIQNVCTQSEKKIDRELQAILLEAMRLKDEADQKKDVPGALEEEQKESFDSIADIQKKLEEEIGETSGVQDIYQDNSWDEFLTRFQSMGEVFNVGKLRVVFVNKEEANDYILIPGEGTIVISVNPESPRDRILQVLGE
jgi:CheY-like chemotaxis protein